MAFRNHIIATASGILGLMGALYSWPVKFWYLAIAATLPFALFYFAYYQILLSGVNADKITTGYVRKLRGGYKEKTIEQQQNGAKLF